MIIYLPVVGYQHYALIDNDCNHQSLFNDDCVDFLKNERSSRFDVKSKYKILFTYRIGSITFSYVGICIRVECLETAHSLRPRITCLYYNNCFLFTQEREINSVKKKSITVYNIKSIPREFNNFKW